MGAKLATDAPLIGALTNYDATPALVCFSDFRFRAELYSRRQPRRRIDGFLAYGRVTRFTTVDGSVPDAQKWLPGVVSGMLNIKVRSTTARTL